jgi:hypothetical protein
VRTLSFERNLEVGALFIDFGQAAGGPTMMARIGIMRALNRNVAREFNPDRKDHHWGRRKLKRDQ